MADRRLQVFMAVAKHLNFTRAADELFMSQPAVTFQIKQLEELYSTRLFERRHGNISLTSAGELVGLFSDCCMPVTAFVERIQRTLSAGQNLSDCCQFREYRAPYCRAHA